MTSAAPVDEIVRANPVRCIEVFADISCPFAHAGLRRFDAYRRERGVTEPILRVRAWPLELVNHVALDGITLAPKIDALRADVAPDLFAGFRPDHFPATTLPALAAEAAAHRMGLEVGEAFSFAIRDAVFEEGLDISDPDVLDEVRAAHGVPRPRREDECAVRHDFADGKCRGVAGSPHFFTPSGDFFCPSLDIEHVDDHYEVRFDVDGFERFIRTVFSGRDR